MPLIGTTYVEPVAARVDRMASLGLVPVNTESFWFDDRWRAEYRGTAASIVARHSGEADPEHVRRLIVDRRRVRPSPRRKSRASRPSNTKHQIPLVIRIDDVVCEERTLDWLLDLLASRGIRASLEVVPYLRQFDETFLRRFDPNGGLFEVSQHGYAHVPRTSDRGWRCEFSPDADSPTAEEREAIAQGKTQLEKEFSKRFSGGFSPPFDVLPPWLPATWHELGGTFVSCLHTNSVPGSPLRIVRAGVDVWDWSADRALSQDVVTRKLAVQLALEGHMGIVLHPWCLRDRPNKSHLLSLLNHLEEAGAVTVSLKDLALGKVESAPASARINPLRRSFVGNK